GRYKASGKTLAQVNRELHSQLARFLKNPDVIVRVLSYEGQRFSVQGSVTKGGQFYLIGRYKASGKTLAQVNRELHSQLARFLKNPDVIV
ncbi:hypothetical protein ED867_20700, partial [Acinetobacter baumannii]